MPVSTGLNAKLLRPGLKQVYGMSMKAWVEMYSQIFTKVTSDKRYEEYQELAGFGLVPEQTAGQNVIYDEILNGSTNKVLNVTYGLGYQITREMIDDNLYQLASKFPKSLAKSVQLTIETLGANILNRAFNTSYTYGDGSALCVATHSLPSGGTLSNRSSGDPDLSETSLEQAFVDIAAFVDARGNVMQALPRKLVINPFNKYMAVKLLSSEKTPGNNYNSINPVVYERLLPERYIASPYLTDTDAWFLLTDQEGLICQNRVAPEFRDDNDFESLNIKQATYFRMAFSAYDPRAIYGSQGS